MTLLRRAALDAHPYPRATLDALVAAIDVDDLIDPAAPPPPDLALDHHAEQLVAGFRLSRQSWQDGFDRRELAALTAPLVRGGTLDADGWARAKQMRARLKHLRFAFVLYADAHHAPRALSLITLVMGELQDAARVGAAADVRRHAGRLRVLLSLPAYRILQRGIDRVAPTDAAGFRAFAHAQASSLAPILATPRVGAHAFHAARKVVSRRVSFHDDMRVLYDGADDHAASRWLATLNGLMGRMHDDLVSWHAAGSFDYRRDTFELPDDIRARLTAFVALHEVARAR